MRQFYVPPQPLPSPFYAKSTFDDISVSADPIDFYTLSDAIAHIPSQTSLLVLTSTVQCKLKLESHTQFKVPNLPFTLP
jgi:hypothetical protein